MRSPANAAAALATALVDELVRGGLRHLVLCPGSRSAPLAFAARAAEERGRLILHTRLDERTAGFLALGLARSSRHPVAVVVTSGTAVANLHPSVLEAGHAGIPLVLLTADRPWSLRGTGANQTTDQVRVYGGAVRLAADVAPPVPGHDEAAQVTAWRSLAARAVVTATGGAAVPRGPVHLNLQLAEPLTPLAADGWTCEVGGRGGALPWILPSARPAPVAEPLDDRRTLVVAGDDAGPPARVLAETGGWPLLAEPSSGSRTGTHAIRTYRLLLADEDLAGPAERVVVFGHPTLSRPVAELLGRGDVEVLAVPAADGTWCDPGHGVARVVAAPVAAEADDDPGRTPGTARAPGAPSPWLARWLARDAEVSGRLDALLETWPGLTPHHVAGAVAQALGPGGLLFVGASNPIRDLDLMVPRYRVGDRRMVLANRGLAGIDGTVSSAVGAALGRRHSTRALALLGDVTFLHDAGGLVIGPGEPRPDLTLVVPNDDGGSIFAGLEQGAPEYAGDYDRLFGTPHGVDLSALCAATGTAHRRVRTREELVEALASPGRGLEVVEAVVRRDDRRALDQSIRELVG